MLHFMCWQADSRTRDEQDGERKQGASAHEGRVADDQVASRVEVLAERAAAANETCVSRRRYKAARTIGCRPKRRAIAVKHPQRAVVRDSR